MHTNGRLPPWGLLGLLAAGCFCGLGIHGMAAHPAHWAVSSSCSKAALYDLPCGVLWALGVRSRATGDLFLPLVMLLYLLVFFVTPVVGLLTVLCAAARFVGRVIDRVAIDKIYRPKAERALHAHTRFAKREDALG